MEKPLVGSRLEQTSSRLEEIAQKDMSSAHAVAMLLETNRAYKKQEVVLARTHAFLSGCDDWLNVGLAKP